MRRYKHGEVDRIVLTSSGERVFGRKPFPWQLDAAIAILEGCDTIIDVGTGSGKTLAYSLPLVLDEKDMSIIISPLSALMVDQMTDAPIKTIAICAEIIDAYPGGKIQMFKDITKGKFQCIIVSPEVAISQEFALQVLVNKHLQHNLRSFVVDEAHCVCEWGGSFRADYTKIGSLRGRIGGAVPFVIASATLPEHVLDVVKKELHIDQNAQVISLTNERPNIALSVRVMKHDYASKADLRFLVPKDTSGPINIPVTLVYTNQRIVCEDICDRLQHYSPNLPAGTIAFYHAHVGVNQKRQLEKSLRDGSVRILCCTDAMGMGCDFRNIERVILWELPPTFSALVQRIGRASRDLTKDGEAILIIRRSTIVGGEDSVNVNSTPDHEAHGLTEADGNGIWDLANGEGCTLMDDENEDSGAGSVTNVTRTNSKTRVEELERAYLLRFATTHICLRIVWNDFFKNHKKAQLVYGITTLYRKRATSRCCYNCDRSQFPMEDIVLDKKQTLKRGRRAAPGDMGQLVLTRLLQWRAEITAAKYPGSRIVTPESVLSMSVINTIVSAGRLTTEDQFLLRVRWARGIDRGPPICLNEDGRALLSVLQDIYEEYDLAMGNGESESEPTSQLDALTSGNSTQSHTQADTVPAVQEVGAIPPDHFYGSFRVKGYQHRSKRGKGQ